MDVIVQKSMPARKNPDHDPFSCISPRMIDRLPASNPLPSQVGVVVIGAGAAGIAAAQRLIRPGLSLLVLEARNRLGGRAWTQRVEGEGLDMGCGWLHSADDNVLAGRVEAEGLTLDQTPPPWRTQAFDHEMTPADQADFRQAFDAFDQRVSEAAALFRAGLGEDRPASDFFDPDGRWNARIDAISGAMNGARFAEVSSLDYDAYGDTGVNWRVREGYGRLIARLGEAVSGRVVLDCAVRRIDRSGPLLRLETSRGELTARIGDPDRPQQPDRERGRSASIRRFRPCWRRPPGVPLGLASKVHMTVRGAGDFQPDTQLWVRGDTAETGGYHLRPFGRPMIEAYFGADLAWGLEAQGPAAVVDFAVSELVAALGSDMRRRLEAVAVSGWGVDPWSRGAYSHALPGHAADRAKLRTSVEDRIFLAGEATAPCLLRHGPRRLDGGRAGGGRGP
jgi:monoamine oxidase